MLLKENMLKMDWYKYKQKTQVVRSNGTSCQSSALEVDSWWLGLGRKTAEQSQLGAQMRTCLIKLYNARLRFSIPKFGGEFRFGRRLKDHGRDKLAFSMSG
jgi:hypothetical protein